MCSEVRPVYQPSGRVARHLRVDADRLAHVGPLLFRREVPVVDPFEAVARDLPIGLLHRGDRFRVAHQRRGDAVDGHRHAALGEHPPQAPEAGPRAVFVDRFHAHVPLAEPCLSADDLRQECFRGAVAVEDVVFPALLVIDHELDADPRIVRPARMRRIAAVADEVAGIRTVGHVSFLDRWNSSRAKRGAEHGSAHRVRRW